MRAKLYTALFAFIFGTLFFVGLSRMIALKKEIKRYENNQTLLLTQKDSLLGINHAYRFADSLNALKTMSLEMTLKEYAEYRAQDLQTIEQLNVKKKELEQVVSSQALIINELRMQLFDSVDVNIVTGDTLTLKCFSYKDTWLDLLGCIDLKTDSVSASIVEKVPLSMVETVKRKRFLGFLWKTRKVKSRHVDVFSDNPHVIITNVDFVHIE